MTFLLPQNKHAALALMAGVFLLPVSVSAQENATPLKIKPVEEIVAPDALERRTAKHMVGSKYKNYLSFSYENDLVGDGTDRYYTSGVRLTYFNTETDVPPVLDEAANALPGFDLNETTSTFFSIGQNLFSPSDISVRELDEDERPYAAWLYGSIGMTTLTEDHLDELEVTIGVVGPEALGEQTQKFIHTHITDSPTPKGWSNQLDFEPGLILSWQRRWPQGIGGDWYADLGHKWRLNVEPNVNVSIGNIYTYAGTGVMFTLGPYQDTLQDTPPRVRPAMAGTGYFDVPDQNWSWYVFAGLDGRAVARNIFLDGNSFDSNSPSVDKKPLVGDAVAGIAFTLYDYRLSYTANYRTKEFEGQDEDTLFGSITLTTRF